MLFVDKTGDDTKKEVDKINQQIKENMKTLETKISLQEKSLDGKISKHDTLINEFKSNIKDLKTESQKTPKQGTLQAPSQYQYNVLLKFRRFSEERAE